MRVMEGSNGEVPPYLALILKNYRPGVLPCMYQTLKEYRIRI